MVPQISKLDRSYYHIGAVRNYNDNTCHFIDGALISDKCTDYEFFYKSADGSGRFCLQIHYELHNNEYTIWLYPEKCSYKDYCLCEILQ